VPIPVVRGTYNDVAGTRALLQARGDELAAVIVEPMIAAAGCIPGTSAFLAMLREETSRRGIVLIFDEVVCSRLGPGGMQGRLGLRPDLTTLGKAWGGGLAFGAFGGSRGLMRHLDLRTGGALSQGGTFNNNVLAMSAGVVAARDVHTPAACERLNALGDSLREQLNGLGRAHGVALQATGIGGVMTLHWHDRPIASPADADPPGTPLRRLYHFEMLERGVYLAPRGMINLSLPLLEREHAGRLDALLAATGEFLRRHAPILPRRTRG